MKSINPYFYEYYNKKIQTDETGCAYILFRIDIFFTKYFLAVEIDEKGQRSYFWKKKKTKGIRKKNLTVNLLELILVEKIMMQAVKLVEYRHLLIILIEMK